MRSRGNVNNCVAWLPSPWSLLATPKLLSGPTYFEAKRQLIQLSKGVAARWLHYLKYISNMHRYVEVRCRFYIGAREVQGLIPVYLSFQVLHSVERETILPSARP